MRQRPENGVNYFLSIPAAGELQVRPANTGAHCVQVVRQDQCRLASFCRETAIRRRSNPSLTVGALMVSLKLRDFESEPRPLGSVLTRGNRVSRQKRARRPVPSPGGAACSYTAPPYSF